MKKIFLGLLAVTIAFTGVAYTNASKSNSTTYWFVYNEDGTAITPVVFPNSPPTTNPENCPGGAIKCVSEFLDYEVIPGSNPVQYRPVGSPITTLMEH